jgi:omega-6 fatty acid desaturase (delta-12 desaturase)
MTSQAATVPGSGAPKQHLPDGRNWKEALAPYAEPRVGRSILDIATSVVPYLALSVAMYFALDVSYWLVLAIAVPAAGFLVRTFILFHDCGHGSFLPSKRANAWVGRVTSLFVFQAYASWRHEHAVHHATSGDLERRGVGDVDTLTVAEYRAKPWYGRLEYRLMRNPLVMFGIGPIWALAIEPRYYLNSKRARVVWSVILTDIALVLIIGPIVWLVGWEDYLMVQVPTIMMAGAAGIWLFYVQHQFEDAYWEDSENWSYAEAALRGSSYLKLPKVLQFFTGNIGLHHVHHLNARIPNYNLQRAHDDNPIFHDVPTLTIWDGLRAVRLKVWDEERGRLVGWAGVRKSGFATAS